MMILPKVKEQKMGNGICTVPERITYSYEDEYGKLGAEALASFVCDAAQVSEEAFVRFVREPMPENRPEMYTLAVSEQGIRVGFDDARGAVNAAASVVLLLRKKDLPCCEIWDYPSIGYRSFMIDMARGLPTERDIKRAIRYMALAKYNRLHLHLIDENGPCYVSEALPEYRFIGKSGQCDIAFLRELDRLCEKYAIEIVPEIEIPAHGNAICHANPTFMCQVQNAHKWAICPGNDDIWPFFDALIGEISEIFPRSTYIHIGTDELEFTDLKPPRFCHWDECPRCADLRKREGLADRQAEFYYLVEKMHGIVRSHGKKMMMWNDQIDVSRDVPISRDILIQFWRIASPGRGPYEGCSAQGFLEKGFHLINAHYPYTYCDMESYLSAEKMKTWTPYTLPEGCEKYAAQIVGGESCAWEYGNYEEYPFYGYTTPAVVGVFGDKLWGHGEREFDEEYLCALSEYIFGDSTFREIFDYIGGPIPPRTAKKFTYVDPTKLSRERISACAARLSQNAVCEAAEDYVDLLGKIMELIP